MALTIPSCERFPIDLLGHQARLNVPDLVAQVGLLERGIDTIRLRLLQRKRDRGALFVTASLERADQSRNPFGVCIRPHPPPPFTAHRPPARPPPLRNIAA